MVNITINNMKIEVSEGTTILNAAKKNGINIPKKLDGSSVLQWILVRIIFDDCRFIDKYQIFPKKRIDIYKDVRKHVGLTQRKICVFKDRFFSN